MYEAYSFGKGKIIKIEDATDLNEIFGCPNSRCSAKFKVKSVNGKVAKHFAKTKSSDHILGCPYNLSSTNASYYSVGNFIKASLDDIYDHQKCKTNSKSVNAKRINNNSLPTNAVKYIRTPKQLLYYCISNPLKTEYLPGVFVDDIILDSRNLKSGARFEGINGVRLLLGNIVRIKIDKSYGLINFEVSTKSNSNNKVYLTASVFTSPTQAEEIKTYISNTFHSSEKGKNIAVLADWVITKKYHVKCNITQERNIIYKFTDKT